MRAPKRMDMLLMESKEKSLFWGFLFHYSGLGPSPVVLRLQVKVPGAETVLVLRHIPAFSPETHSFHFQASALLQAGFVFQLDFAAGSDHSLPRQGAGRLAMQQIRDVAVVHGVTRRGRDLRVSRDLSFRNGTNRLAEGGVALGAFG